MYSDILIVDDEEAFHVLIGMMLKRWGHRSRSATSAARALEAIRLKRPDAIILDDLMPGMTGIELCTLLKQDPELRSIPVVFYTASVRYTLQEICHHTGAEVALIKNGKMAELANALNLVLNAKAAC